MIIDEENENEIENKKLSLLIYALKSYDERLNEKNRKFLSCIENINKTLQDFASEFTWEGRLQYVFDDGKGTDDKKVAIVFYGSSLSVYSAVASDDKSNSKCKEGYILSDIYHDSTYLKFINDFYIALPKALDFFFKKIMGVD